LNKNFDLNGKLYELKKGGFVIRLGRKEYQKIKLLVKSYFHESMLYKLP
jgi:hypothetical protein